MKKVLPLLMLALACKISIAQSDAAIHIRYGTTMNDIQNILYFEGISHHKFNIKSDKLKGKNFQIIIKELKEGKIVKVDTAFNSNEDEYFRLKADSLPFSVLTKMNDLNEFKIQFQFDGFSTSRKFPVKPETKDKFALKGFFGAKRELPVTFDDLNYFLAYMMPYVRPDKSEAYCEVAQAGVDPEKLYDKYKIPHYFLIAIRFE